MTKSTSSGHSDGPSARKSNSTKSHSSSSASAATAKRSADAEFFSSLAAQQTKEQHTANNNNSNSDANMTLTSKKQKKRKLQQEDEMEVIDPAEVARAVAAAMADGDNNDGNGGNANASKKKKKQQQQQQHQNSEQPASKKQKTATTPAAADSASAASASTPASEDASSASAQSHSKSNINKNSNSRLPRKEGESDDDYKARLKLHLRAKKLTKKAERRHSVGEEKRQQMHAEAEKRKEEKQRAHLLRIEQQKKERERKEQMLREAKEKGLSNKQIRAMMKQQRGEHGESAENEADADAAEEGGEKQQQEQESASTANVTANKQGKKQKQTAATKQNGSVVSSSSSSSLPPSDWDSFHFHPALLRSLLIDLRFTSPTPVQQQCITPAVRDYKNVFAAAQTGSGKTLAFAIPVVQRLLSVAVTAAEKQGKQYTPCRFIQALILTPTRELALQINTHIEALLKHTGEAIAQAAGFERDDAAKEETASSAATTASSSSFASASSRFRLRSMSLVGGLSLVRQLRLLSTRPSIVVATPGRLWELLDPANVSADAPLLSTFFHMRAIVVDEADRMAAQGHYRELQQIFDCIASRRSEESRKRAEAAEAAAAAAKEQGGKKSGSSGSKQLELFDGVEILEDLPAAAVADGEDDEEGDANDSEDDSSQPPVQKKAKRSAARTRTDKSDDSALGIDWSSFVSEEEIFRRQGRRVPKEMKDIAGEEEEEEGEEGEEGEEDEDEEKDEDEEGSEENEEDGENSEDDGAAEEAEEDESGAAVTDAGEEAEAEEGEEAEESEGNAADNEDATATDADAQSLIRRPPLQVFLFSATLNLSTAGREDATKSARRRSSDSPLDALQQRLLHLCGKEGQRRGTHVCDITTVHQVSSTLEECQVQCVAADKDSYVYYFLLLFRGRTIVFVNSISCLRRLVGLLTALQLPVFPLHAEMQQKARLKSLERFKSSDDGVLVCTDVAARGLDIPQVPYVIHYQFPRNTETYIHRSGRVARAGKAGVAFAIIDEGDTKLYRRLCIVLKRPDGIPPLQIDSGYMQSIRQRLGIAKQIDELSHTVTKATKDADWWRRQSAAVGFDIDEDELAAMQSAALKGKEKGKKRDLAHQTVDDDSEASTAEQQKKMTTKLAALKAELQQLMQTPLRHQQLSRKFYTQNAARGFDLNESGAIAKNGMNAALSSSNGTTAANSAVGNLANNVSKLPKLLQQQRAVRTAPTATVKTIAQIAGKKRKANSSDAAKPNAGKTASSDTDAPAVSPSTQHKSKKQRVR